MTEQTDGQSSGRSDDDVPRAGAERAPVERGSDPVDLSDRTDAGSSGTGYTGSPVGNQGRSEPMPPTPGHPDPAAPGHPHPGVQPLEPPLLEDMNVGAADPQRPSLPTASPLPTTRAEAGPGDSPSNAPRDLSGPGAAPAEVRPERLSVSDTGTEAGPSSVQQDTPGVSHRTPGLQGTTSPAEQVETDVQSSAAAMQRDTGRPSGAGDTHGVEVPSGVPSPGTSEEHGVVQGARIPASDGTSQDRPQ